jgi:hypothetical protein
MKESNAGQRCATTQAMHVPSVAAALQHTVTIEPTGCSREANPMPAVPHALLTKPAYHERGAMATGPPARREGRSARAAMASAFRSIGWHGYPGTPAQRRALRRTSAVGFPADHFGWLAARTRLDDAAQVRRQPLAIRDLGSHARSFAAVAPAPRPAGEVMRLRAALASLKTGPCRRLRERVIGGLRATASGRTAEATRPVCRTVTGGRGRSRLLIPACWTRP